MDHISYKVFCQKGGYSLAFEICWFDKHKMPLYVQHCMITFWYKLKYMYQVMGFGADSLITCPVIVHYLSLC